MIKNCFHYYRISLDWQIDVEENSLTCKLQNAFYSKEKLSILNNEALHISDIKFTDIAGQQRVKNELLEVLALLKEPHRLQNFGMLAPKGMLLYGQQGMGKKLLAKAFACQSDMPYIAINGADLFNESAIHHAYV